MNVLLLNCYPLVDHRQEDAQIYIPPLHQGYLAAVLEREGCDVAIVEVSSPDPHHSLVEDALSSFRPDLVGISSMTWSFPKAVATARRVKRVAPTLPVVVGGCHVTFTADNTLLENPEIDIVVRGEGEMTLLELVRCIAANDSLQKVQGISYRQDGNSVAHTPDRPFIADLNTLPLPARHLVPLLEYEKPGALIASRGCPHRCIFCAASAMSGHRYRIRQPDLVVDEVEHLYTEYGVRDFIFMDDTFTALPKRLTIPVCRGILARRLDITFGCESRVDVVTPELIALLVQAGARSIEFGIESGSQKILDRLSKRITLQQVRDAVRCALDAGLGVACDFMLGHPDETEETARQTVEFIRELRAMGVGATPFYAFTPFPGTAVYENPEEYGVHREDLDWKRCTTFYPVIRTRHLSRERLRELFMEMWQELVVYK
jgi:anaerobic magnesium-protoporphyrin IX monomethyl ester cyclase